MSFLLPKVPPSPPKPTTKPAPYAVPKFPNYPSSKLELPPTIRDTAQDKPVPLQDKASMVQDKERKERDEFYINVGMAVRTLREDIPNLFARDLNYDIYREDITFMDPLNTFEGLDNYKLIFWALRFHGRILFKDIGIKVFRVWQPSENSILIRWELQGVPRVPWEARGRFQGTSRYKLDRRGKIYEHKVDNLAFNFPRTAMRPATVLDMVGAACPTSPNPTFGWDTLEDLEGAHPWVELYRVVKLTLEQERQNVIGGIGIQGLATCT